MEFCVETFDGEIYLDIPYCDENDVPDKLKQLLNYDIDSYELIDDKNNHFTMQPSIKFISYEKIKESGKPLIEDFKEFLHFLSHSGPEALGLYASEGDEEHVRLLLDCCVEQKQFAFGYTPLIKAAMAGNYDIVKMLIDADPNADKVKSEFNLSPLNSASARGHYDIVKLLLDSGFEQMSDNSGNYPIHLAIDYGNLDIVKLLSQNDVIESEGSLSGPALIRACRSGRPEILEAIIDKAKLKGECTLLIESINNNSYKITKFLLERGYDTNEVSYGITPIIAACRIGDIETIKLLIEHGAKIAVPDGCQGLLHHAAYSGCAALIDYLMDLGVKEEASYDYLTPIHIAAKNGNGIAVKKLFSRGIKLANDMNGNSPLHFSVAKDKFYATESLLSIGCKQTANDKGETPIMIAVKAKNKDILELLLENNPFHGITTECITPLYIASERGDITMVNMLIKGGACKEKARPRLLAIIAAREKGYHSIVKMLLEA